jgi:hypothetical protein
VAIRSGPSKVWLRRRINSLAVRPQVCRPGAARLCDVGDVMKVIGASVRGAELTVTGIAETRHDKCTLIEALIN